MPDWISYVGNPVFGGLLALVGILIAVLLPFYQHQITHLSRSRYKKELLADISLIETYHVLRGSGFHNTMMTVTHHSATISFIAATGSIIMILVVSASSEFDAWTRLLFYVLIAPFTLWLNFKVSSSSAKVQKAARALMTPLVVLGDIDAALDRRKASILTETDKQEIRTQIDKARALFKPEIENALSTPSNGNVTT